MASGNGRDEATDELLRNLDEMQQEQEADSALQESAFRRNSASPSQGGIGSFMNSAGSAMNMGNAANAASGSAGATGFAGALTPAIGSGTGTGATGLFGLGGMSEMAGGATGSSMFTLGGGGAAGGGAASGGLGSAASSAGPWAALAAAIVGNELYAKNHGERDGQLFPGADALEGRALVDDVNSRWAPMADKAVPGLGNEFKLGAFGGSPADWFDGKSRSTALKSAVSGGILGNLLKKIF